MHPPEQLLQFVLFHGQPPERLIPEYTERVTQNGLHFGRPTIGHGLIHSHKRGFHFCFECDQKDSGLPRSPTEIKLPFRMPLFDIGPVR